MERDRGGGVCCLFEVPEGCSCQVNAMQCTLEGIKTVVGKYMGESTPNGQPGSVGKRMSSATSSISPGAGAGGSKPS